LPTLCSQMRERELAVFFRNNHFSTIFKVRLAGCGHICWLGPLFLLTRPHSSHAPLVPSPQINGSVYLLVTDIGFRDQPSIVWERLDEVGCL
jgi:hypothetical protein